MYMCVCLLNHLRLTSTFHDPKYFNMSPKSKNSLKNHNTVTTFYKFDSHSVHFPTMFITATISDSLSNPGSCIIFDDILLFIITLLY